jgi:RNA polymerase sigma factor (sigma-70 family)
MHLHPFERIVEEHGPLVLRVCRAVLGPHDAEDAWSETFLAALQAYPRLRPDSDVPAWLVTIAHRKAIDHVRAAGRRAITVSDLPDVPDASATDDVRHESEALWDALRALPLKQRQTVVYHHLVGMPYREVAAVVGGTEDAARRAAADGIAALRRTYPKGAR